MNIDRKVIEQALDALENTTPTGLNMESDKRFFAAIDALREALAQPHPVQPTNCRHCGGPENVLCAGQCRPVQQEPVRPERQSYVPVEGNMRDGNGNHPNDKEPRTAACIQALNERGDSEGQGLDRFWKWGFAAGFNAALASAPQPQPVQQEQCPECDGTGTVAGSQAHFPCPLCTSPQAAQPLSNADGLQISRALHQHGLTLVRTVQGFGVMKLGEITAYAATKGTT